MNFTLKRTFIPLIMLCKKPSKKFKDNYYTLCGCKWQFLIEYNLNIGLQRKYNRGQFDQIFNLFMTTITTGSIGHGSMSIKRYEEKSLDSQQKICLETLGFQLRKVGEDGSVSHY